MPSVMSRQICCEIRSKKLPAFLQGCTRLPRGLSGSRPDVIHKDCVVPRCTNGLVKVESLT